MTAWSPWVLDSKVHFRWKMSLTLAVLMHVSAAAAQPETPPPSTAAGVVDGGTTTTGSSDAMAPAPDSTVDGGAGPSTLPASETSDAGAQLEVLRRRVETPEGEAAKRNAGRADERTESAKREETSERVKVTATPGKGVTFTRADDRLSLTLRARAQIRETFVDGPGIAATNEIHIKTLRFIMHGHVLQKDLRYNVQLAFGGGDYDGNASPIFDAYVEYVGIRDLNLRFGQYFVPFDRARTMREFGLEMVDRPGIVREMTLERDVGLMASSDDLFGSKVLGYRLFVGGGDGKNRFGGERPAPISVARLVFRPWGNFDDDIEGDLGREERPRLAIGVGAAYNRLTPRTQSTYGPSYTLGQVDYGHAVADALFKLRGFSLLVEGLMRRASDEHLDGVVDGVARREWTRAGHGYVVQSGMMLSPHVQVVARWEQLFEWGRTDPQLVRLVDTQGNQAGGGINVYLNGHAFKLQGDYFVIFGSVPDERHAVRLQLDATF
jgi:hypothetical protein